MPTDIVTILNATYDGVAQVLRVTATSSAQPKVNLVTLGYGKLKWNGSRKFYQGVFRGVSSAPLSLTVTSTGGGSATYSFAADTVTIQSAIYDPAASTLTVVATSSAQPNVSLSVQGLGSLTWNSAANVYSRTFSGVTQKPSSVTVTSSGGGSATQTLGGTQRIVVDPITRIEGHLRIETEVQDGKVTGAWSSGTLFRGVELILQGREPEDAWLFTQRLCGVCTYVHASTSVRCVENALSLTVTDNARIIRNLLMGGQYLHDHIVHFYHLHALDWVDVVSALGADPAKTTALAKTVSPSAKSIDFAAVQARLKTFVNSGKLGPFAEGYWGHPAYTLSPEENLLLTAHYLEALRQQVSTARMHAIFGAKNPHLQSLRVGGVTCKDQIIPAKIEEFRTLLLETRAFIENFYLPDVLLVASKYPEWTKLGGNDNFLAYGEFPQNEAEPQSLFFPQGVIVNRGNAEPLDTTAILEHVAHSWYQGSAALHPSHGETLPLYADLDTKDRYSWLKAPRYKDRSMEVGPLARVLVAYKLGHPEVTQAVNDFLYRTKLPVEALYSTLGRTAARALETKVIADAMFDWLKELTLGGNTFKSSTMPSYAEGMGLNEAPRGALGHWIRVEGRKIGNYQMVVPSTWNFGPRCAENIPGPAENALAGTPVADPSRPLEILRTVHSLDPCIACAVHVIEPGSDRAYTVRVV